MEPEASDRSVWWAPESVRRTAAQKDVRDPKLVIYNKCTYIYNVTRVILCWNAVNKTGTVKKLYIEPFSIGTVPIESH